MFLEGRKRCISTWAACLVVLCLLNIPRYHFAADQKPGWQAVTCFKWLKLWLALHLPVKLLLQLLLS